MIANYILYSSLIIVPLIGSIDPVVAWTVVVLQGRQKAPVKADLAIYSPVSGVSV